MAKPKLTNDDFCRAAKTLRCEVADIKTVADVESKGKGFYANGFPVILFERHKFREFTDGVYNHTHPHLSGPAGNYGEAGQNQINKFNEAFKLDPIAAMKSCSWGKFQIMGFNHKECGFATVGDFVDAMKESEGRHLDAFVGFVKSKHLADELRRHDWAGFAHGYNGAGYKKNAYDTKMAAAYKRFAAEAVDCSQVSAATSATPTHKAIEQPEEQGGLASATQPPTESTPPPVAAIEVKAERASVWSKVAAGFAAITGLGINLGTAIENKLNAITPEQLMYVLGGLALIGVGLWIYDRAQRRAHEKTLAKIATAADPTQTTVELKR